MLKQARSREKRDRSSSKNRPVGHHLSSPHRPQCRSKSRDVTDSAPPQFKGGTPSAKTPADWQDPAEVRGGRVSETSGFQADTCCRRRGRSPRFTDSGWECLRFGPLAWPSARQLAPPQRTRHGADTPASRPECEGQASRRYKPPNFDVVPPVLSASRYYQSDGLTQQWHSLTF